MFFLPRFPIYITKHNYGLAVNERFDMMTILSVLLVFLIAFLYMMGGYIGCGNDQDRLH